jgi:hypothetical protein
MGKVQEIGVKMSKLTSYEKGYVDASLERDSYRTSLVAKLSRSIDTKDGQLYLGEHERALLASGDKLVDKLYDELIEAVGSVVVNKQGE